MSMPSKENVRCPKCGTFFTTTIFQSVNTDWADDIEDKIISGSLFEAKCPNCGNVAHLEYDVLYHDLKRHVMIWVVHHDGDYDKKIKNVKSSFAIPGYRTRIVSNMNELREKVAMLAANRDDRVIELCKLLLIPQVSDQNPGFVVTNSFYTFVNGEEYVFFYNSKGNELGCILPKELPKKIEETFKGKLDLSNDEKYAIYDSAWAQMFFASLDSENLFVSKNESSSENDLDELNNQQIQNKDQGSGRKENAFKAFLNKYKK